MANKNSTKINEKVKKEEVNEDVKKVVTEKQIQKSLRKVSNDKIIIISIIVAALVIAFSIFGVILYKTNFQAVVTFNGGKITKSEYTLYFKRFSAVLQNYGYPEEMVPEYIANIAASDKILLEEAKKAGITLSEENKKTVDTMFADEEQVASIKELGIDMNSMKTLYYNQYIILQYIDKIANDASDETITNYIKGTADADAVIDMNKYNTRHILFKTVSSSGTEMTVEEQNAVKTKAEAALARVNAGEDFATVAKELSEDTGTKENGGEFAMYMDGNVLEEYVAAAKSLQPGQVHATLVKTMAGYHIIKLDSIVENGRVKNPTEREAYANGLVDKVGEDKNVYVNKKELEKLIESLTGKKLSLDNNTTQDNTGKDNTEENQDTK